ncbi:MAG: hypothetical protein WB816_14365 [Methylocystis sp.]
MASAATLAPRFADSRENFRFDLFTLVQLQKQSDGDKERDRGADEEALEEAHAVSHTQYPDGAGTKRVNSRHKAALALRAARPMSNDFGSKGEPWNGHDSSFRSKQVLGRVFFHNFGENFRGGTIAA